MSVALDSADAQQDEQKCPKSPLAVQQVAFLFFQPYITQTLHSAARQCEQERGQGMRTQGVTALTSHHGYVPRRSYLLQVGALLVTLKSRQGPRHTVKFILQHGEGCSRTTLQASCQQLSKGGCGGC